MRKKRLLVFFIMAIFIIAEIGTTKVFALNNKVTIKNLYKSQENLIEVKRNLSGDRFDSGEKFNVNYKISPKPIIDENHENKDKEIVLVLDTSGSMNNKISQNSNETRLDKMKSTLKQFISKFNKEDIESGKVKIKLIGYSSYVNFQCDVKELNKYLTINEKNIKEACNLLNIDRNEIYSSYYYENEFFLWDRYRHAYKNMSTGKIYDVQLCGESEYYRNKDKKQFYIRDKNLREYFNYSEGHWYGYRPVKTIYDLILSEGGTNIGDGLRKAYYSLSKADKDKYIILMTDGNPTAFTAQKESVSFTEGNNGYVLYGKQNEPIINWRKIGFRNILRCRYEEDNNGEVTYVINYGENDRSGLSLGYANLIGRVINKDKNIQSFIVGLSQEVNPYNLTEIARNTGASRYYAKNMNTVEEIYKHIGNIVQSDITGEVYFEESIPEGVEVVLDDLPQWINYDKNSRKLSGVLKVSYTKNEKGEYIASPIDFSISLFGVKPKQYELKEGTVKYKVNDKIQTVKIDSNKFTIDSLAPIITKIGVFIPNNDVSKCIKEGKKIIGSDNITYNDIDAVENMRQTIGVLINANRSRSKMAIDISSEYKKQTTRLIIYKVLKDGIIDKKNTFSLNCTLEEINDNIQNFIDDKEENFIITYTILPKNKDTIINNSMKIDNKVVEILRINVKAMPKLD
ncbi:VWA domain-containing protein [Clostridium brassicae]|uniref:VWA domain-containing protein n=1 Tax=Clostridium brassicae TaxID=2999072 RepID=A0ABT4DAE7_9CLOT|nr:VWA domain-containing protein [Clostridium brassicae]MCY6959294.1 VWA domain-containing protein [Clostridium brassicae]